MSLVKIEEIATDYSPDFLGILSKALNFESTVKQVLREFIGNLYRINPNSLLFTQPMYSVTIGDSAPMLFQKTLTYYDTVDLDSARMALVGEDFITELKLNLTLSEVLPYLEAIGEYLKSPVYMNGITTLDSYGSPEHIKDLDKSYHVNGGCCHIPLEMSTAEDYLNSLPSKKRSDIKRSLKNADPDSYFVIPSPSNSYLVLKHAMWDWSFYKLIENHIAGREDNAFAYQSQYHYMAKSTQCFSKNLYTFSVSLYNNISGTCRAHGSFAYQGAVTVDNIAYDVVRFDSFYSDQSYSDTGTALLYHAIEELLKSKQKTSYERPLILDLSSSPILGYDNSYAVYKNKLASNPVLKHNLLSIPENKVSDTVYPPYYNSTQKSWVLSP